jgi:hypothetical protein
MCVAAVAEEKDVSGTWEAGVHGAQVVIHVTQSNSAISGVAHVSTSSGGKSSYPFVGAISGVHVRGTLVGGHTFSGKIYAEGQVAGMLRTKDGQVVPISASRR